MLEIVYKYTKGYFGDKDALVTPSILNALFHHDFMRRLATADD